MNAILQLAISLAKDTGAIQLSAFRSSNLDISYKSSTDLVTNIDQECEHLIFSTIRKFFPDHAIVSEEGSVYESNGPYIWYVDPLDGTNNYAHGLPFFCTSIGIYSRKLECVEYGVVYNPYHEELFVAQKDNGAVLNEQKISPSQIASLDISILATGFPYDKSNPENNNSQQLSIMLPKIQGIRRMGSAALDLCYVACGRLDGYWEQQIKPWDVAAGSIIVEESGGLVTTYSGGVFHPEHNQIIASNHIIHDELIQTFSGVR